MLNAGRVDLWPVAPSAAALVLQHIGAQPDDFEVVAYLESAPLYYAISKDVSPSLVGQLQAALDQLRRQRPHLFPIATTNGQILAPPVAR
jgi:ABC-type phosphate/phosphonate transport system substrate-binding protein